MQHTGNFISIVIIIFLFKAAAAGITPEMRAEQDEKISVLTDKINVLVEQAEKAGCEVGVFYYYR